jgi:hypothetical protein
MRIVLNSTSVLVKMGIILNMPLCALPHMPAPLFVISRCRCLSYADIVVAHITLSLFVISRCRCCPYNDGVIAHMPVALLVILGAQGFLLLGAQGFLLLGAQGFLLLGAQGFLLLGAIRCLLLGAQGFLLLGAQGFLLLGAIRCLLLPLWFDCIACLAYFVCLFIATSRQGGPLLNRPHRRNVAGWPFF